MPKPATKSRKAPAPRPAKAAAAGRAAPRPPGRPARAPGRERRQIVVDASLLAEAMRLTGRGQSDTVNAALAQLTENAAILAGLGGLFGAFPAHPEHADDAPAGRRAGGDGGR